MCRIKFAVVSVQFLALLSFSISSARQIKVDSRNALLEGYGKQMIENEPDDGWKELATSVFCNTTGDASTKVSAVTDALVDSYGDDFMVFATESSKCLAYSSYWWTLDAPDVCGSLNLLAFRASYSGCSPGCEVGEPATLLQTDAMNDSSDCSEARDLIEAREKEYGLRYSSFVTFDSTGDWGWSDWLVQKCSNTVKDVNSQNSLWDGDCR